MICIVIYRAVVFEEDYVNKAKRMDKLKNPELLMLMELANAKDMISFAGGFPSEDVFPIKEMELVTQAIFRESGPEILQYATTSGYEPLREAIAERITKKDKVLTTKDDLLITSGSQQALGMLGMLFLDENDVVLVESPTYIGALNAFNTYEPNFIEIPTDDDGMNLNSVRNILERRALDVKMIYVIPDFQNPTGRVWSKERRIAFMEMMSDFDIPVIEDRAYSELAYEDLDRPSLKSIDTKGQVISLGTFSKIFCPGLRVGWVHGNESVIDSLRLLKPNVDLSSPSIGQRQVYEYMKRYDLDEHIKKATGIYKVRRDLLLNIIKSEFPQNIHFTQPKGGLFTWIELPTDKDAKELLRRSMKKKVAFVPGNSFYPKSHMPHVMRVNFSNMENHMIEKGGQILGQVMKDYLEE